MMYAGQIVGFSFLFRLSRNASALRDVRMGVATNIPPIPGNIQFRFFYLESAVSRHLPLVFPMDRGWQKGGYGYRTGSRRKP